MLVEDPPHHGASACFYVRRSESKQCRVRETPSTRAEKHGVIDGGRVRWQHDHIAVAFPAGEEWCAIESSRQVRRRYRQPQYRSYPARQAPPRAARRDANLLVNAPRGCARTTRSKRASSHLDKIPMKPRTPRFGEAFAPSERSERGVKGSGSNPAAPITDLIASDPKDGVEVRTNYHPGNE